MYILNNWKQLPDNRLAGNVYGNPRFDDGEYVTTSPVVKQDSNIITTYSDSIYMLGTPVLNISYQTKR